MKAITFLLSLNEETPIETKVNTTFENGAEISTYAKSTRSQIMHQLRAVGCSDSECTKYSQTIRTMLNQFDEASDYPVTVA